MDNMFESNTIIQLTRVVCYVNREVTIETFQVVVNVVKEAIKTLIIELQFHFHHMGWGKH
jgi:hypothetical protein